MSTHTTRARGALGGPAASAIAFVTLATNKMRRVREVEPVDWRRLGADEQRRAVRAVAPHGSAWVTRPGAAREMAGACAHGAPGARAAP